MAIVGHWLVGFLFSYCFPQTGVALFLKLSMASDGAVLIFPLLARPGERQGLRLSWYETPVVVLIRL